MADPEIQLKKLEPARGAGVELGETASPIEFPEVDDPSKALGEDRDLRPFSFPASPSFPATRSGGTSEPVIIPGRPPGSATDIEELLDRSGHDAAVSAYPPAYSVTEVDPRIRRSYPYSAMGKLFVQFEDAPTTAYGSAALIGDRVLLTAAHCLDENKHGDIKWALFVAAYDDGSTANELGRWSVKNFALHPRWSPNEDRSYDVALCQLRKDNMGRHAGRVCGYLGVAFNSAVRQHWHACGYPSERALQPIDKPRDFDGGDLFENRSGFAYSAPRGFGSGRQRPVGIGSNMTKGCSGGPWVLNLSTVSSARSNNLLNGVSSFRRTGYYEEMFSPYFGPEVKTFYSSFIEALND